MKRPSIIPTELIPAAIEWERLREVYWTGRGLDTKDIRLKITGLERRVQTESTGAN